MNEDSKALVISIAIMIVFYVGFALMCVALSSCAIETPYGRVSSDDGQSVTYRPNFPVPITREK